MAEDIQILDPRTLATDEDRHVIYEGLREAATEARRNEDIVGWAEEGVDPYTADWQMDLSWPNQVSVQDGDGEWVPIDELNAEVVEATLVCVKPDKRFKDEVRMRASTMKRIKITGADDVRAMREAVAPDWKKMQEDFGGIADPFGYGLSQQAVQGVGGVLGQYLPLWPGPVTRQLYWQDYWQMSAKSFEAYNHDPISWRMIHLKAEFALGKGLALKITKSGKGGTHDQAKQVFEEFWNRNKMGQRLDTIARDFCWGGEQFLRYFKKGPKLTIRSLDPATIYDLITDPEDIETVFAYHQQFQTAYQLYPPTQSSPTGAETAPTGPTQQGASVRYIIRQILPQEIDHYRANCSSAERRGRSDLFPALGWIKRLRDYLTSHVIQADMLSRICWDLQVAGNQSAIQNARGALFPNGQPPPPGTVFGHNSAMKLEPLVPQQSGRSSPGSGDPILDALVTMISLSGGVPKDWLGFGLQNTRAGALVATEPASKALDALQKWIEQMLHDCFNRVMTAAGIFDAQLEVIFPSITDEERKDKLDDIGTMEANGWISKQTAGTIAAKEMGITTYDYDQEQKLIAREFPAAEQEDHPSGLLGPDGEPVKKPKQGDGKPRRTVIIATKRQAEKIDITKSPSIEVEPPGVAVPTDGSSVLPSTNGSSNGGGGKLPAPGSPDGTGRTVAGGGNHKDSDNPMTSSGAKAIKKEGRNLRQAEEQLVTMPVGALHTMLLRERAGARRRPDDPDYEAEVERYRAETADHIKELVGSAIDPPQGGATENGDERS